MTILDDAEAVAVTVATRVAAALAGGARTLVLAGGTTPGRAYAILAGMAVEWGRVTVLFGDERCVPPGDPASNYRMAAETLLGRVTPAGVLRIPAELGPEAGAAAYDAVVGRFQPLDLVLLGVGEDGHCASLFPGNAALGAPGWAVGVRDAPKPPPDRVSLTLGCLRNARRVIFIATGAGKAEGVRRAQAGEVPAGMVPGAEWLLDRAAAG